eukprot:364569-Chlamydomonas_euryale.AAC.28
MAGCTGAAAESGWQCLASDGRPVSGCGAGAPRTETCGASAREAGWDAGLSSLSGARELE